MIDLMPPQACLSAEGRRHLSKWWSSGSRLDRTTVGAPGWAEYIDRYGGLWTRSDLCTHWLQIMECNISERGVANMVKNYFANAIAAFEKYLRNRIDEGTLVELVGRNHDGR